MRRELVHGYGGIEHTQPGPFEDCLLCRIDRLEEQVEISQRLLLEAVNWLDRSCDPKPKELIRQARKLLASIQDSDVSERGCLEAAQPIKQGQRDPGRLRSETSASSQDTRPK